MASYYIGLDCGSTAIKAVMFDTNGNQISTASGRFPIFYPQPGFIEYQTLDIWNGAKEAIKTTIDRSGVNKGDIKGIGACAWGNGAIFIGEDGSPSYPAVNSGDGRANPIVARFQGTPAWDKIAKDNKVGVVSCNTAVIALWLKENDPDAWEKTKWVCNLKDYLNFKLCGKKFSEPNDVSGAGYYNWNTKDYAHDVYKELGIPEFSDKVAELASDSLQVVGGVTADIAKETGLPEGCSVIAGMMDITACGIACGLNDPTTAVAICGTWSINQIAVKDVFLDNMVAILEYPFGGTHLQMSGGCTSATNTEWFMRSFGGEIEKRAKELDKGVYDAMTYMASQIPAGGTSVTYLPFIASPRVHLNASAGFLGVQSDSSLEELLHALYEGITFDHRRYMDEFIKQGYPYKTLRLAGGGAKSAYWAQLFADICNVRVETVPVDELGALGICMSAGIASGDFKDFDDACDKMLPEFKVYTPNPENVAKYEESYQKWIGLVNHLCAYWDKQ